MRCSKATSPEDQAVAGAIGPRPPKPLTVALVR